MSVPYFEPITEMIDGYECMVSTVPVGKRYEGRYRVDSLCLRDRTGLYETGEEASEAARDLARKAIREKRHEA